MLPRVSSSCMEPSPSNPSIRRKTADSPKAARRSLLRICCLQYSGRHQSLVKNDNYFKLFLVAFLTLDFVTFLATTFFTAGLQAPMPKASELLLQDVPVGEAMVVYTGPKKSGAALIAAVATDSDSVAATVHTSAAAPSIF